MADAELDMSVTTEGSRVGLVDRAIGALERLPGSAVLWVVGGVLALGLVTHALSWLAGETPTGDLRVELLFPLPFLAYFLLLIVILDGIARSAFDEFRASLDLPENEIERLKRDLTSIPDLPALAAMLVWTVFVNLTGPDQNDTTSEPFVTNIGLTTSWFLGNAALALLVVHTVRQLRQVGRLQAMVAKVNLLDPGPINAFSRLTAATSIAFLIIGVAFAVVDSSDPSGFSFGIELVIAAIGIAFFVLPLRGMHGRLAREKGRLLGEANSRLQHVIARIHRMVDADDLGSADELQKAEAALLAERDLYLHLSTWPWSTGTFRGILSAVMLPIFIGVVLRLLTRVI